jgi:hypothetical protein
MKIGHPKDFWGGVLFAVIGLLFAVIAFGIKPLGIPGYAMGVPARMGPAFFPFYLGMLLFILGVIIAIGGFRHEGPADTFPQVPLEADPLRAWRRRVLRSGAEGDRDAPFGNRPGDHRRDSAARSSTSSARSSSA